MSATTTDTPPDIALVRAFVNTVDLHEGVELLRSPLALGEWLCEVGLLDRGTPASGRDLKLGVRLRDALRGELDTHHGGEPDLCAAAALDEVCVELPLRAVCAPQGLASAASGVRGALGQIVAAATTARINATWPRLKICPGEGCGWAFYDPSRNHSKRWCSMEVCGNRSKVRAFRERAR